MAGFEVVIVGGSTVQFKKTFHVGNWRCSYKRNLQVGQLYVSEKDCYFLAESK
jgi:hypothetical protein